MRLGEFITTYLETIVSEWVTFAATLTPAAHSMSKLQLQDHIKQILQFVASDIESDQSPSEQTLKSKGMSDQSIDVKDTASEVHGSLRHADGFDIVQMVSEYRALRASVIKLWTAKKGELDRLDLLDLTRFNESIDQSLAESVARFMQKVVHSKDLLLGVLGHDIRSPLGAIIMSATMMARVGPLNEKQTALGEQIENCGKRVNDIVADLLDLTRARLGSGLRIERKFMDLGALALQIVEEMRIQNPDRTILLEVTGDSRGEWDRLRLGQVLSNLISNAVQYGFGNTPISVRIDGEGTEVTIRIHNRGKVISTSTLATLFDSFTRGADSGSYQATANLGLGLFITKEIVQSHDGTVHVISNEMEGTTFSIKLSRNAARQLKSA